MTRTDRRSPTGFLVRYSAHNSHLFIVEYRGANGSTDQSTHTSVFGDETPEHMSRSEA